MTRSLPTHGWVNTKGSSPPIRKTWRIGKYGMWMMKASRGKVRVRMTRMWRVYGETGVFDVLVEFVVALAEGDEPDFVYVEEDSLKWAGERTKWWTWGSVRVNRSDLEKSQPV